MAKTDVNKPDQVDTFMAALEHPFKAEVERIRETIKGVHPGITEQIKWNAPSFSYQGYMMTFNLKATDRLHLVWHNGIVLDDPNGLLEGDYPDRRMSYFASPAEVKSKLPAIRELVQAWINTMDTAGQTR